MSQSMMLHIPAFMALQRWGSFYASTMYGPAFSLANIDL
jgi:hypothetical protein